MNLDFEDAGAVANVPEMTNRGGTLTEKSRQQYDKQYNIFMKWLQTNKFTDLTEYVFLNYFMEKAKIMKSSSLWAIYSMLKATFIINKGIDIGKFVEVVTFLKKKSVGYKPEQSKVLTKAEINAFISQAADDRYLMMKVSGKQQQYVCQH